MVGFMIKKHNAMQYNVDSEIINK